MNTVVTVCLIVLMACLSTCRDYYIGMFKRNDFLVAQDRLYKELVPFRKALAKYGKIFPCVITYFRVVDRLGYGGGPRVQIIRGGLQKKYIVAKLTSPYNLPISVNIYVGCENKMVRTTPTTTPETNTEGNGTTVGGGNSTGDGTGATGDGEAPEEAPAEE